MLQAGPRSTYQLPPTPQANARQLASQILASIRSYNAAASEVRPGTVTTGCDGLPLINPLNGTNCNGAGAGPLILYNPQTRTMMTGNIGRAFTGVGGVPGIFSQTVHPFCETLMERLKSRRRFTDDRGNIYGPTGLWLSPAGDPAALETEYIHRATFTEQLNIAEDPPKWYEYANLFLLKTTDAPAVVSLASPYYIDKYVTSGPPILSWPDRAWPTGTDASSCETLTYAIAGAQDPTHFPYGIVTGMNDATFSGIYDFVRDWDVYIVQIDTLGSPDTFKWASARTLSWHTNVAITADPIVPQSLEHGISVTFGSQTGHTVSDSWLGCIVNPNVFSRNGVGVRGTILSGNPCILPNNGIMLTSEDDTIYSDHALVVRDADTLAQLYRKPLQYDGTSYAFGSTPEKFCFSTNDEGLFFMQAYTVPVLTSPPSPFPGHEFGAPNPRKIAVVAVDTVTFEPTIRELITLEDNGDTAGSTFALASTQS